LSYFKNYESLGNIVDVINKDTIITQELFKNKVLAKLAPDKIYRILITVKYIEDGIMKGSTPMTSMQINRNISGFLLIERIKNELRRFEMEYNLDDYYGEVFVGWKEWLNEKDFNKDLSSKEVDKILNDVLLEDKKDGYFRKIKEEIIDESVFDYINKSIPTINSIKELSTIDQLEIKINGLDGIEDPKSNELKKEVIEYIKYFNNKMVLVDDNHIPNIAFDTEINKENVDRKSIDEDPKLYEIKDVYLLNYKGKDTLLFVYNKIDVKNGGKEHVYCIVEYESWKDVIKCWNLKRSPFIKWTDILDVSSASGNKIFLKRVIKPYILYLEPDTGELNYLERYYSFSEIVLPYKEDVFNDKYGTLDLETLVDYDNENLTEEELNNINIEDLGLGKQEVYAGGWKVKVDGNDISQYFIIDKDKIKNSHELIKQMFEKLFEHEVNKSKIFAHNLGRFDALFLIRHLVKLNYEVRPLWKDNAVLQIKIFDPKSNQKITILDSINFFSTSLKTVLKRFDCNITKGEFPHLFVTMNNLNYIGSTPNIKYYKLSNIRESDYNELITNNWNLRRECLKYLKSDVEGLFEIISKASEYYFEEYKLNMSNYLTLPSLSLAIFGSNFFNNEKYSIKMVKGPLEKYLRASYFGGNVQSYVTENHCKIGKAFHYDLNSQYPKAMIADKMPVGNPVFSTKKDLNYYSGFVYANIIPPKTDILKNLFIQCRDEQSQGISCPRTPFIR
jgi:hypothetical protein